MNIINASLNEKVHGTNYIGGEFVSPQSKKYISNFDPSTGEVYGQTPDSDAVDVVFAVQAANKAFEKWSQTTKNERAQILNNIADKIEEKLELFAVAESRDVGKPLWLAREVDLPRTILNFRYFADLLLEPSSAEKSLPFTSSQILAEQIIVREPLGVAGLIAPWNLPLYTLTFKIAPALAMGNTVVCKPSELTPVTAHMLAQVMSEVGLPPGVCNFIFGRGETAGAALVQHPGVPLISFTGGTATAEKIQAVAAPKFKRLSLELGGKNANIVLKDADVELAVKGSLRAAFLNSGQICLCGSRLYVQDEIYDTFMARFRAETKALVVGDPADAKTFMGPLVSAGQLAKVAAAVEKARAEKGEVTVGGEKLNLPGALAGGYFYAPTIIEELTACSELWQEEIFGPVVTVKKFKYAHEAVKLANTSPYGLSASLWTADAERGVKLARQIQAGTVWLNTWGLRDVRAPFGGYKSSGIGREGGQHSFDFFSETKTICVAKS